MRILVRPCYPDWLKNDLFVWHDTQTGLWLNFFVEVRKIMESEGVAMDTWDMAPLSEADIVLSLDLPPRRAELLEARAKAPRAKFILQHIETPLDRQHHHDKANHDLFDAVITYNKRICDEKRYFFYRIPVALPATQPEQLPFDQRKPLVMINSNRSSGFLRMRQNGLAGLPGLGPWFSGWHVSPAMLWKQTSGQLYHRRRRLGRAAEKIDPAMLDIYGYGWQGQQIAWYQPFIRHRPYACARGVAKGLKYDYLRQYRFAIAFENMTSDVGYISEKIYDVLFSGAVPIYLGDAQIGQVVPPDCFVDARRFKNDRQLLEYVAGCPEAEWAKIRAAGQAFIHSAAFDEFKAPAVARRMLAAFRQVAAR